MLLQGRVGLVKVLRTGLWNVAFAPTFTSARKSHEQGQSPVKVVDQQLKKGLLSIQFHDMHKLSEHDILNLIHTCHLLIRGHLRQGPLGHAK